MSTWKGILKRKDLGTGVWVLDTGAEEHQLDGSIPAELEDEKVIVEGTEEEAHGFGMLGGQTIAVSAVRKA